MSGTVWLFPAPLLWVLGKGYLHLEFEVVLNVINGCLGLISGASFAVSASRGWAIRPIITILLTITSIICNILLFDISILKGRFFLKISWQVSK